MLQQCYVVNLENSDVKAPLSKEKVISYEEKSVGSTSFFKCEACPYMALAEDDIKFHMFTFHPDLAKANGLADNVQIQCPGCTNVFDAEETLRTHLRNHHKMGVKDIRKMIKSLVQIALKNAKLRKEEKNENTQPNVVNQPDIKIPQVIEIIPDNVATNNEMLPKGVAFISVDELQKMSTPNFEKIDPKEIIQEASINIVYTNDISTPYVSEAAQSTSTCNVRQMTSVPPDLISSIQPSVALVSDIAQNNEQMTANNLKNTNMKKLGRPIGSRSASTYIDSGDIKEVDIEKKLGKLCGLLGCRVRLKDEEKLSYHKKCHQNEGLQCPECKQMLLTSDLLHTHLWRNHSVDMELFTCEICGFKSYSKYKLLGIHMKCHGVEKSYTCTMCTKSFKNSNQLAKHKLFHKKESKTCTICERDFVSMSRLKIHIAEVHDKLKPFKCCHCDYTAARKVELKLHLRAHTGDKPYSCNLCSYRSGDHNAMRRHKKTHSRESPYKCKYCPYSTIQSTVFTNHMTRIHPDVKSDDLHQCSYCAFKTVNKDKYVTHLANHSDKEGIHLLREMVKSTKTKPSWNIPSDNSEEKRTENIVTNDNKDTSPKRSANKYSVEVFDVDQDNTHAYPPTFTHTNSEENTNFDEQITDLSRDDNSSVCLISESSDDTLIDRHATLYTPQHRLQNIPFEDTQNTIHFLNPSVSREQDILQNNNTSIVSSLSAIDTNISNNIMNNFPIRLPLVPQISVRNHFTLKPVDKIFPMTKVTGPIITPTQILPVPSSSNSPVSTITCEPEGVPRKKPKISVKSNLVLKGPDQVNMFHSQQKMAFKRLEDNERFGLDGPVTFNNLITTQFMQLATEPALSESPNNILQYPQEPLLVESATPPVDNSINDTSEIFTFNQPKIQASDPSYIKLEGTIKQNTQSPSLERMCNANSLLGNQNLNREYKASPPLEDIHKNMNEIKNEVKSDYYNIPLSSSTSSTPMMDPYLMDNLIGEQYGGHLDISSIVLPVINEVQQSDVIEIDDNSDDTKLLPRFDMNFPLESLYLMHTDFHFLENDIPTNDVPVNEMNRMVTEVPIINQKDSVDSPEDLSNDFPSYIQGKTDPMMNTSVKPTNKINVKNIELMKN